MIFAVFLELAFLITLQMYIQNCLPEKLHDNHVSIFNILTYLHHKLNDLRENMKVYEI